MPTPPTTPRHLPRGRRPKWDVDRLSPRHQIFKTKNASLDSHGKFARWMENIEASFNPSLSPPSSRGLETLTTSQNARPPLESRSIRRAVSRRTPPTKPRTHQAELEAFRQERRESGKIDSRRAMVEDRIPKIGEDDMDFIGLYHQGSPDAASMSLTSKKRGAEEALDEPMPDAPEGINIASPQTTKRQRSNSGGSSSARTSSSSSSSARRPVSSSSFVKKSSLKFSPAKISTSTSKLLPTLKEVERMELKQRRPSPKGTTVVKPNQFMDHAHKGKEMLNDVWHTFLAELPAGKLERKLDWTADKLKSLKLEDLFTREFATNRVYE
ncbi:MAG: hypothetical protein L6R38_004738 [Xanthoria sp. 2 TBL-2021]|nr:MAG: hypothetical protein L6R38_004738 [Xanthoria sp. 2 TBL-2021]